ncbi:hypothetical protein OP862_09950 [Yersinia massiliensis]|uniref:Uncharacterized protein n=1 Tax=Yersinia massiliensis TaxID=419257 RepID=A0AA91B6U4_9GAMM|nr:hypothetical protein [Yersinia massiliensis]MDA5550079.1 hypothetical protein [Yersinia massiliensis]NIL26122.1 hypothetical protein [Yersinia massiliensis]UZM80904.1 hypothetical protein OP862_09950 [Yersinia massiliensis]
MKKIDNPAARLHQILLEGSLQDNNLPCRDVWFDILKVSEGTEINLLRAVANTAELADKIVYIRDDVLKTTRAKSAHWHKQVKKAFGTQNLKSDWGSFNKAIDSLVISELDMLAMIFEQSNSEENLDEEILAEFKDRILILREEIISSELDKGVQYALLALLKKALEAIEMYQITGAGPIMEAVEASIGKVMFDQNLQEEIKSGIIGKQFGSLMGGLANFVTIAQGVKELAGPAITLLLGKS